MQPEFVEIKSALWQKIFASVVALPFIVAGLACCASPWLPIFSGPAPRPALAIALGLLLGGFFFCFCWWPIMRYSIRADREGISQFNGFFRQSVCWSQVESYYLDYNPRYYSQRRSHVEPVLLNARGEIVFQGFAHVLKSTIKIIEQRRELWRFVEAQLQGKRVEKPFVPANAHELAVRSFNNVNWSAKSLAWKIARVALLIGYATLLLPLTLAPFYYVIANDIHLSDLMEVLLMIWLLTMSIAPLLVRAVQVTLKKRRLIHELNAHEVEEKPML